MTWILAAIVLVFLIRPLRRAVYAVWRFVFSGLVGAALALMLSARVVELGAPAWIVLACPVAAFFMIGAAGKEWFDQHLGPPRG